MRNTIICLSSALVIVAVAYGVFKSYTAMSTHGRSHPSSARLAHNRQLSLVHKDALTDLKNAAANGTVADVQAIWSEHTERGLTGWDVFDYFDYGIYLLKHNKNSEARACFEYVINRPDGGQSTLTSQGRVYVLWFQSAPDATAAERQNMLDKWAKDSPAIADLQGMAKAEYLYGQELMVSGSIDQALSHYKKMIELAPNSSFAHETYGHRLLDARKMDEAKAEFIAAYRLAPSSEKERIQSSGALSAQDVAGG